MDPFFNRAQVFAERELGPHYLILKLKGEIDLLSSEALRHELSSAVDESTSDLHLDLSAITYIDSAGVAILVGVWKRLQQSGRELRIDKASPQVQRILEFLQLEVLLQPPL